MSILKIRDENGNVHPIAIMKGDKGDGVPDGGTTGQVIKKTESGTEWGDTGSKCEALFTNTDTSVNSCAITKRGLYEVKIAFSLATASGTVAASTYSNKHKFLMSVSDLSETQEQEVAVGNDYISGVMTKHRVAGVKYEGKTFYAHFNNVHVSDSSTTSLGNRAYLAEVRLIIPYE